MKIFTCHCGDDHLLFFESCQCIACQRLLGYADDQKAIKAFDPTDQAGVYQVAGGTQLYTPCTNYSQHHVCNAMIPLEQSTEQPLCRFCQFNEGIPDLSIEHHQSLWHKLELAKRRTLFTLDALDLPLITKQEDPEIGLSFSFLADKTASDHFTTPIEGLAPVFTGHANGLITINIAEADDVARTQARVAMGERYRTLLGHFRHEIGHYYWDLLIRDNEHWLAAFRDCFGDEQIDYQEALDRHYQQGAPANWQNEYISEYATMHPWEDFAETWAHYLHVVDTLETAQSYGLQVKAELRQDDSPVISEVDLPQDDPLFGKRSEMKNILKTWVRFSVILNSLNRSMGLPDAYPFVLNKAVENKLTFIHRLIHTAR
jgi:hypothetical protein